MVKKNIVNKIIAFVLMVSIFAMTFSFDGNAAEFELYPSNFINPELYLSYDDINYFKYLYNSDTVDSIDSDLYYMQVRLYFLEPLQGNSTVNFKMFLLEHNLDDVHPEFLRSHVLSYGTVVKTLTSSYFDFEYYGTETIVSSSDISFHQSINVKINCITLYFKVDLSNSSETISRPAIGQVTLNYKLPDKIDSIIEATPEDQNKVDEFSSEFENKTSEMDSLVDEIGQLSKPDLDTLYPEVNEFLPADNDGIINIIFNCIYVFGTPVTMITLVFIFGMIGYVLYGKR